MIRIQGSFDTYSKDFHQALNAKSGKDARFRAPSTPPPHTVPHRPFNEAEQARQAASFPNLAGFTVSLSTVDRSYSCRIGPIDLCPVYLMLIRFWLIHRTDALRASGSRRWMLPIIIEGDGKETNEVLKIIKIRSLQVCLWRKSE